MNQVTRITVVADEAVGTISPLLHGHFAEHLGRCCNDGLWVGPDSTIPNRDGLRADVMDALGRLGVPQLRWPGGCYADTYHWRDGIGPRDSRPRTLGESCGLSVVEDNGLGTHEFIALCKAIGAEPYLAGNMGSGSPREMMDWVHYCNGTIDTTLVRERAANGHPEPMDVKYWGVGNENWGCGGNYDPVDYAKEFRRYATFLRMADSSVDLVACGDNKRDWNLRVVETLRNHLRFMDHLSVHQYYVAGPALGFSEAEYYQLMRADEMVEEDIRFTDEILRFFESGKRRVGIAFDEWGVWHPEANKSCDYEAPNTMRDAVASAGVLDVFHRWCGRVTMANLAQIVNVLQCLIQTHEDRMWLTPTYHLFAIYRPHQGGESLRVDLTDAPAIDALPLNTVGTGQNSSAGPLPLVSASASRGNNGVVVSVTNRRMSEPLEVEITIRGENARSGEVAILSADAPNAVNSAERPDRVAVRKERVEASNGVLRLTLAPCSVQTISLAAS
jgi:alpha-N-arabinofuranosidase